MVATAASTSPTTSRTIVASNGLDSESFAVPLTLLQLSDTAAIELECGSSRKPRCQPKRASRLQTFCRNDWALSRTYRHRQPRSDASGWKSAAEFSPRARVTARHLSRMVFHVERSMLSERCHSASRNDTESDPSGSSRRHKWEADPSAVPLDVDNPLESSQVGSASWPEESEIGPSDRIAHTS